MFPFIRPENTKISKVYTGCKIGILARNVLTLYFQMSPLDTPENTIKTSALWCFWGIKREHWKERVRMIGLDFDSFAYWLNLASKKFSQKTEW